MDGSTMPKGSAVGGRARCSARSSSSLIYSRSGRQTRRSPHFIGGGPRLSFVWQFRVPPDPSVLVMARDQDYVIARHQHRTGLRRSC